MYYSTETGFKLLSKQHPVISKPAAGLLQRYEGKLYNISFNT